MNLQHVIARRFEPMYQSWDWRDAALYALGLGMGENPLDENELAYVYEGRDQRAVPSMGVTLGWPPLWIAEPETGIAWTQVLHGEQRLKLHRPLPAQGSIRADHRVSAIVDKGPARGALLYFDTELFDTATGERLASLRATDFLRGDGGCGGYGTPPNALAGLNADASPIASIDYPHLARQPALPPRQPGLHADPRRSRDRARRRVRQADLARPEYDGSGCRAILKRFAPGRPERLSTMAWYGSSPAFPGDTIRIEMFEGSDTIRFRAWAVERQVLVLDRGECRLAQE
jgi:hypothetical protein